MLIAARFVGQGFSLPMPVYKSSRGSWLALEVVEYLLLPGKRSQSADNGGTDHFSSIIISDMYSMRDRSLAQGLAAVFNGVMVFCSLWIPLADPLKLGLGLGGPIGGYISDRFGWRWAFLFQLPLFFVSFALTSCYLNYTTTVRHLSELAHTPY